jgi:predicted adenine nucleotide alpha hydrolase (AANH) superfamily ATPase
MKVLLHTCCAPCLIYPLEVLRSEGFEVEAYFYNPNIHPEEEYAKRKCAFLDFALAQSVKAHIPEYRASDYRDAVTNARRPGRCKECWGLRLLNTARFAKENNFSAFTSALLVSPYQDIEAIKTIGQKIAERLALSFIYRDFRPGFREAHNKARAIGIYCQKYCGCSYSLEERKEAQGQQKRR